MVSLSIDEFHIFKAAHRSWTLLALVRISNSRCYASRAHSVQKSFFFLELPIFPERPICTGWPKLFSKEIACEVIQIHICYCTIFYISRDHYAEPKQCFGSYVMTKKKCILHWSHFTLFHRALMSVHKEVVWNVFWNPLLYF